MLRQVGNFCEAWDTEQGMFSGALVQPTLRREGFVAEATLPAALFEEITELRIHRPGLIEGKARRRKKRARLTRDGRLVLVALDHPARGATQIRGDDFGTSPPVGGQARVVGAALSSWVDDQRATNALSVSAG